jgi:hypothetical protein
MGRPEALRTGPRKGPDPNVKEVFWEILAVDQHGTAMIQRFQGRQQTGGAGLRK